MPDSKEPLGGFHIIDVAGLSRAIAREAALYGVVEVRPVGRESANFILQTPDRQGNDSRLLLHSVFARNDLEKRRKQAC